MEKAEVGEALEIGLCPEGRQHGRVESALQLTSREVYKETELTQRWSIISELFYTEGIKKAWSVKVKERLFVVAECNLPLGENESASSIEQKLSLGMERLCFNWVGKRNTPLWVSRVALDADVRLPPDWLSGDTDELEIAGSALVAKIGWGNSVFTDWVSSGGDHSSQCEVLKGMIDAQFLWCHLNEIKEATAELMHNTVGAQQRCSKGDIGRFTGSLEAAMDARSFHRLAYDELLMDIQGSRRNIARSLLKAWGYEQIVSLINERISLASDAVMRAQSRINAKAQAVIENSLIFVALLSAIDFFLSLYSFAISGTDIIPWEGSLVLRIFSGFNFDLLFLSGVIFVLILVFLGAKLRQVK